MQCNVIKKQKESLMIYELEKYFGTCAESVDDRLQFCYEIRLQTELFKFVHNFDKLCKKFYRGFRGRMKACQTLGVVSRICLCLGPCLIFVNPWLSPSVGDTTPGLEACHLKTDSK